LSRLFGHKLLVHYPNNRSQHRISDFR